MIKFHFIAPDECAKIKKNPFDVHTCRSGEHIKFSHLYNVNATKLMKRNNTSRSLSELVDI